MWHVENRVSRVSIIGLGYVGLPLAIAFANKGIEVEGFDINTKKINLYKNGIDVTNEIGSEALKKVKRIHFTSECKDLKKANFHIVAVPTPIRSDKIPDLVPVKEACEILGKNLREGSTVVFESTVYPGVTEEICVPILEKNSGLKCSVDFKVGYSPERINPGDEVHTVDKIIKVVSAMDEESLELIASTYSIVAEAGVYKAPSIRIAEAAKVIENSQRDINIAFMNELSIIFDKFGIDTQEVLRAASTKWNFLNFYPGLVGGHCIGVDPYYLTYKAEQAGYMPQVILSGRRINDNMGTYIAEKTVKKMIESNINIKNSKCAVLGLTFKENCPDIRNSKVYDIIKELQEFGIQVKVSDPYADCEEAKEEYGINLDDLKDIKEVDAVIIAVAHKEYRQMSLEFIKRLYGKHRQRVLIDVKGILNKQDVDNTFNYWRL